MLSHLHLLAKTIDWKYQVDYLADDHVHIFGMNHIHFGQRFDNEAKQFE